MDLGPGFLPTIDLLPEPMVVVSINGTVLAANNAFAQQLGIARQLLTDRPLQELSADSGAALQDYLQSCARSGQLLLGAISLRGSDGEPKKYRAAGGALRIAGQPDGARAVLMRLSPAHESGAAFIALNDKIRQLNAEIERRHAIEVTLRKERETLQVTLSSIGDAVIVADAEGRITFLNAVAATLVGLRPDEALGRALPEVFRIVDESSLQPVPDPVQQVLRTGSVASLANQSVLIRPDGKSLPIDDSAAPIRLEGRIIGVVVIFRDVSARRQSETALREADRRKDEFLATLAHELRNPLAPIRSAMQIMALCQDDAARTADVRGLIERQLKHLVRLIDDLMDVSRITQGRLELRQERVDLDAVLQIAVETSRPLLDSKRQRLLLARAPAPIHVSADVTRLAQVFSNLLNNSSKYSPVGADISIKTWQDGEHVTVEVIDSGVGLAADKLNSIFDMFVQLDRAGAREGLGIGLTLVKRIVELHGGSIEAFSEGPDKGSRFQVRLAISQPDVSALTPKSLHIAQRPDASRARILVADDNRDAAQTLAMVLELDGHDVRTAYDGLEALQVAEQFRPQIMLLDIGMPRMDGYQTARSIRACPWGHAVLLVALTGWGQDQDRRQASEAGFDRHLVKPVDPHTLQGLIEPITRR